MSRRWAGWFCVLALAGARAQAAPAASPPLRYTVSLAQAADQVVRVKMSLRGEAAAGGLQLPVWNALYQVRDFSQSVNWVRARDLGGNPVAVRKLNKSFWAVDAGAAAEVEYEIAANRSGPYGAELNRQHAFFNLAEILMYPVSLRSSPIEVRFLDLPPSWNIATMLAGSAAAGFSAANYDALVDSPVEIGTFVEQDFADSGATYRVVVDANSTDYDMAKLVASVRRIVSAATQWMQDRPFSTYLFLYHFPARSGGGGMEHSYSTAIDLPADVLANDFPELEAVTAHEFFHLWNVKRIFPQSLRPIDYTRENYTRALWFSEGVTSTVENYILLRAGLLDEAGYRQRLAADIEELENRPAHLTQSVEESSLDAWLEKYDDYRSPVRSISYYNKGELLGVILDLAMRRGNAGSLRETFEWMNRRYAQAGVGFPDSEGVRQAAEQVSHSELGELFHKYVEGTDEIPWNDFFETVGWELVTTTVPVAEVGFSASRGFDSLPVIQSVRAGGPAAQAGVSVGDRIVQLNGRSVGPDFEQRLGEMAPGSTLALRLRNQLGDQELRWKVGENRRSHFELRELEQVTPAQRTRRSAWLKQESASSSAGEARP